MDSEGAVSSRDAERNKGERAGLYLALIAALGVPALIVLAVFLPAGTISNTFDSDDRDSRAGGLDRIELGERRSTAEPTVTTVEVEVDGAGERNDSVDVQIGDAASLEAPDNSNGDAVAPSVTTSPPRTTTTDTPRSTTSSPTTSTTNPASTSTTGQPATSIAGTTSTTTEVQEPTAFARRVDLGRIGESTLQFRFASDRDTSYAVTVRAGLEVVSSFSGQARAGVLVNESATDLAPGTDHTLEVTLTGPPSTSSPQVAFRTSGGETPEPGDTPVQIDSFRLAESDATRFEVRYDSNICANGSFVIREQGGAVVGRNAGQASGCTTRHLAIPGLWTAPLEPNTTYTITLQVEANGAGQGNGNTASRSLTVTTTG